MSASSTAEPLSKERVRAMLTSDTKATLAALKKQPDGPDDADSSTAPPKRGEGDI